MVSFLKNEDNDALANRPQNYPSLMESHSGAPYKLEQMLTDISNWEKLNSILSAGK